jgi:hypothetical protein
MAWRSEGAGPLAGQLAQRWNGSTQSLFDAGDDFCRGFLAGAMTVLEDFNQAGLDPATASGQSRKTVGGRGPDLGVVVVKGLQQRRQGGVPPRLDSTEGVRRASTNHGIGGLQAANGCRTASVPMLPSAATACQCTSITESSRARASAGRRRGPRRPAR